MLFHSYLHTHVFRVTEGRADMENRVIHFTSITLMRKRKTRKGLLAVDGEDPRLTSSLEALSWGGR